MQTQQDQRVVRYAFAQFLNEDEDPGNNPLDATHICPDDHVEYWEGTPPCRTFRGSVILDEDHGPSALSIVILFTSEKTGGTLVLDVSGFEVIPILHESFISFLIQLQVTSDW